MVEKKGIPGWVKGCAAGCGLAVVLGIVLIVGMVWWVRSAMSPFERAIEARETLERRLGDTRSYTPPADGAVAADRMEAFLAVRSAQADARAAIQSTFGALPMTDEEARALDSAPTGEKVKTVLGTMGSAFGLVGELGDFFEARNAALLDVEMGLGEYTYIYAMAYYAWLEHSPRDGPDARSEDSVEIDSAIATSAGRVRGALRAMLRNQLESLDLEADPEWRAALEREVDALESDRRRIPWADGLPEAIAASLAPHSEELEASWSAATNPFELSRTTKRGLSIQAH